MILHHSDFTGPCPCGRHHEMLTQLAVVESGCLGRAEEYMASCGLIGYRTAIYDRNTYEAVGAARPKADCEIILDPCGLHADEQAVATAMAQLPDETQVLLAVGAGTVHDVTRYCAWQKGLPFVSVPTAASVDGFCTSVAAMTWEGVKRTLTAAAPTLVLADPAMIAAAPPYLARSGFGDMIGKFIALTDWRIAHLLTGEYYCPRIAEMTEEATRAVMDSADGIAAGDAAAYEKLIYGLLLSGAAMQLMGNSRPASGAEHHISHCIEMTPSRLNVRSAALHGEKVGVGTLLVLAEYHRLAALDEEAWGDYVPLHPGELAARLGPELAVQLEKENACDAAAGMTGDAIRAALPQIRQLIAALPQPEELRALYRRLGVMDTLSDLGVADEKAAALLDTAPLVRNRLTLLRLRRCLSTGWQAAEN